MSLSFQVNQQLDIDGTAYRIAEHPAAPGMPYGQEGRQAIVYQLAAQSEARALKVFKPRFRVPALSAQAERLGVFANLPGLEVCRRVILTPQRHNALLRDLPDLTYAVLMPWIEGETWQGVILAGRPLTREASGALARTLVSILAALEQRSIAHCDLSASNLIISQPLISGLQSSISFVDIEDLYAPGLTQPAALPAGSSGYAHKETVGGLWSAVADRFAGAILIAEMLGWCDTRVRQIAWGEQYFDPSEMQSNTERYQLLYAALKEQAGGALAELFAHAWFSEILDACPAFSDWENALGVSPTEEIMSQVTPPPMPEPEGNLQTRLARAKIESGEVFLALGEADKAVAELEEAYRLFPALAANTYARALWARGEQRENAHNLTGAVADYRLIMQILPDDNPLHSETNSTILRLEAVIMQEHDATSRTQRCSECGREIRADFALCPYCGQPLKKEFLAKAMPRLASGGKYVIVPLKSLFFALATFGILLILVFLLWIFRVGGEKSGPAVSFVLTPSSSPTQTLIPPTRGPTPTASPTPKPILLRTLSGHTEGVTSVAFSADGKTLASGSWDSSIRLWRVGDWTPIRTIKTQSQALELNFMPDGATIVSRLNDRTVRLWRVYDGEQVAKLTLDSSDFVTLAQDGKMFASLESDRRTVRLRQLPDGTPLQTLVHKTSVSGMAFSPDVVILATAAEGGAIRLWRVSDGALLDTFPTDLTIRVMSFSPDGTTLVAVSNESVSAWRVSDWSILRRLAGPKEAVANVAFSPDGALLAATSSASIFLWRVADGVLLRSFTEHGDTVKSVTFSPDGKILASGSQDRTIQLWQLR